MASYFLAAPAGEALGSIAGSLSREKALCWFAGLGFASLTWESNESVESGTLKMSSLLAASIALRDGRDLVADVGALPLLFSVKIIIVIVLSGAFGD